MKCGRVLVPSRDGKSRRAGRPASHNRVCGCGEVAADRVLVPGSERSSPERHQRGSNPVRVDSRSYIATGSCGPLQVALEGSDGA